VPNLLQPLALLSLVLISSFLFLLGFESHFVGGQTPQDIAASMKQFTDLGLEVPLTELDVRVSVGPEDVANATGLAVQ
jgi:endo-1,4-beta-xylanase